MSSVLPCTGYAAIVFNLPEFGENMRFRLSVEPVIWILFATTAVYLVHKLINLLIEKGIILSISQLFKTGVTSS